MDKPVDGDNSKNDKKGRRLSKRFRIAVFGGASAALLAGGAAYTVFGTATGDIPLTPDEQAAAHSLFGPKFHTDDIRKKYVRTWIGNIITYPAAMVPLSRHHIFFFSSSLRVPDLTHDSGADFNLYMHEMTHVWQHRGHWATICKKYSYTLTDRSRMGDFCNEQQASIVGDYSERFLNPNSRKAVREIGDGTNRFTGQENLMNVVERTFPAARPSRRQMNWRYGNIAQCIASYKVTFNSKSGEPNAADRKVVDNCFSNPADRAAATTDTPAAPPPTPKVPR